MENHDHDRILALLNRAAPKVRPRLLVKSKQQPRSVVLMAKSQHVAPEPMTLREAKQRLSKACTVGNISGTDAVELERAVEASGGVSDEIAAYLRGIS